MPTESKLDGKTYQIINTLAATLAQATLKSSAAEKALIAKEFARAFEFLSVRLAEAYAKAEPKQKLVLEKVALSLIDWPGPTPVPVPLSCCVGFPSAKSLEDCEGHGGTWACMPNPLGQHPVRQHE
jgi:hypothetical protein